MLFPEMIGASRVHAVTALVLLGGLSIWLLVQVGDLGGGAVPGPPGARQPVVEPGGPATGLTAEPDAANLEVSIEVTTRARILPGEPVVELQLLRGSLEVPCRIEILTPRDGPGLVEFTLEDGKRLYRVTNLDQPAPISLVEVELGGRVVDEAGDPLEGAEVWYGEGEPGGGETVTTNARGEFLVSSMTGGRGVPVVVTAPGRVTRYQLMDLDGSVYASPLFVLEPGVALQVQLAADLPGVERARVFLAPEGEGDSRLQQFPFFLAAVGDGWGIQGDGAVRIDGLPTGSQVEVIVHHPLAIAPPPQLVRLRRGARVIVPLRRRPEWTGRVVDQGGAPIAGALVLSRGDGQVLARGRHARRWILPPEVDSIGVARDRTDYDGRFAVAGAQLLRITAPGYAGLEMQVESRHLPDIALGAPRSGEPSLRVRVPHCAGTYRVRCRPYGNEWLVLACGQAFTQVLPEASLVDVRVQIRRGGAVGEARIFSGVVVQGVTELDLR